MPLIIFLYFMLLQACAPTAYESKTHLAEIIGKNEKIVIKNESSTDVVFYLHVNRRLFSSLRHITDYINNMFDAYPGESAAQKAWRLVVTHTFPLKSGVTGSWIHEPLPVLNSAGFGLCDDLAEVLAAIWRAQGYRARIWMLDGHVVPEVYENGKWQMYDPSFAVYYQNRKGEVASVEELAASPDLISKPLHRLPVNYHRSFIHEVRKYSEDLACLYFSLENNVVTEKSADLHHLNDFIIHLPGGATIEWPVMPPEPVVVQDGFRQWPLKSFIKYTLPPGWNGVLRLPFVCRQIKGKGQVVVNRQPYRIEGDTLQQILEEMQHHFTTIEIENNTGTTEIYCLFNHAVIHPSGIDTVVLTGRRLKYLSIYNMPNTSYQNKPFINFSSERKISEAAWRYYNFYLNTKESLILPIFMNDFTEIDSAVVSQSIQSFFHTFEATYPEVIVRKAEQVAGKWAEMYPALKSIRFRKRFSFSKDPAYFFYMIALLEHSDENFIFTGL